MQFKQTAVVLLLLLITGTAFSQTTYLPEGSREYILLERMEIRAGTDSILNFSANKPFSRKMFIPRLEWYGNADSQHTPHLTKTDRANLLSALVKNNEWSQQRVASRKPFLKSFYRTPANLFEVNTTDFTLIVNPIIQYYVGKEKDNDQHIFLNTRGATLRGRITGKIGFSATITDNQERDPLYVKQSVTARQAVPGARFYKDFKKTGYDYFDARGYVTFNATRYIDIQFGYDKNFIGNGYRSLFLGDGAAPALFLKLNTRIWRFNYQNLFMELNAANRLNAGALLPKKYAAIHRLDIGVTRWLNLGLMEGIVFSRANHFEFGYLNPVIFYRSLEQQNGSFDNAIVGLDAKANVAHQFQFYGQFLLDEFNFVEMRKGNGWWGNKFGYQLGGKYIDAFHIPNLDLQVELNRVRPFTYSHDDSLANYTHYNQPLAHPLGANFSELIGLARYQPASKWLIEAKGIYYMQGRDSSSESFGSNIFLPNQLPYRRHDYGYDIGSGLKTKVALASLLLSYEWKPNFFIEVNAVVRKESATTLQPAQNTAIFYGGIRWNIGRRNFDF